MSMLSAQCDELRSMAVSVGLAMPQAATLMMEAADTIERLREQAEDMDFQLDKWQTKAEYFRQLADLAEADNAKLREEFNKMDVWHSKELTAAMTENAKLRELCADLYAEMITYSNAPNYNVSVWAPKLRELGVEVTA